VIRALAAVDRDGNPGRPSTFPPPEAKQRGLSICSTTARNIIPVNVKNPDPRFGMFLLEQFGGATGELTAALQYWVQSFHVTDASIRDMLQDIAIEEFSHLKVVGKLIEQHTSKLDQTDVYATPLFRVRGVGPHCPGQPGQRLDRRLY
jgi:hypothetical protein